MDTPTPTTPEENDDDLGCNCCCCTGDCWSPDEDTTDDLDELEVVES